MRSNSETEPAPAEPTPAKRRRINADAVAGGVGFVFALAYLASAFAIPESSFANAAVGPKALPVTIGAALAVASLALAVRGLREGVAEETEPDTEVSEAEEPEEEVPAQSPVRFVVVAGLLLGYIFVLLPLGYVISTFLFLFGTTMYLDRGRPVRNVVYALAFSLIVYFVFNELLTVRLPAGPLG